MRDIAPRIFREHKRLGVGGEDEVLVLSLDASETPYRVSPLNTVVCAMFMATSALRLQLPDHADMYCRPRFAFSMNGGTGCPSLLRCVTMLTSDWASCPPCTFQFQCAGGPEAQSDVSKTCNALTSQDLIHAACELACLACLFCQPEDSAFAWHI